MNTKKIKLIEVDPKECRRWNLADRHLAEFGNLYELGKDIMNNGQVEPIIVRPMPDGDEHKYEVIAGSRRWKACLDSGLKVLASVKNLTDSEAIFAQIRENEKQEMSDYSKGISYTKMIESGTTSISELSSILKMSKAKLHNFLIFAKVPEVIWDALGRKDKISARTAASIYSLSKKGETHINAIIEIADKIKNGAGHTTIEKLVEDIVKGDANYSSNTILGQSGEVVATWKDNKIVFDKNVKVDRERINELLKDYFNSKQNLYK